MREGQVQVKGSGWIRAKISKNSNRTGTSERNRSFINSQFRSGIKKFELLHPGDRAFCLTKSAAMTMNHQVMIARKEACVNVAKLAATLLGRISPEKIRSGDVYLMQIDFDRRLGL